VYSFARSCRGGDSRAIEQKCYFIVPKHNTNVEIIFYLFTQFKGFLIEVILLHPTAGVLV
jgi:hypothetical protein